MKARLLLIDMVRAKVGTDAEIARLLGLTPQNFAGMKAGRRPMTRMHVAALCNVLAIAGEEARRIDAEIAVEQEQNPAKRSLLKEAFFVSWALGVAALWTTPSDAGAMGKIAGPTITSTEAVTPHALGECILSQLRSALRLLLSRARGPLCGPWTMAHA